MHTMSHNVIHMRTVSHNVIHMHTVSHNVIHMHTVSHNVIHMHSVTHLYRRTQHIIASYSANSTQVYEQLVNNKKWQA